MRQDVLWMIKDCAGMQQRVEVKTLSSEAVVGRMVSSIGKTMPGFRAPI
jgi:hypothetical protein